jgi:hypothetical protein
MWQAISETREKEILVVANAYKPGVFTPFCFCVEMQ